MAQEKLKQVTSTRTVTTLREEETGKVKVVYGVHALEASLAGRTVQSVREALAQPLNISPQAVTLVNGQEVEGARVLNHGELLEFVRYAGEKGLRGRSHPSESAPDTFCQVRERWRSIKAIRLDEECPQMNRSP